MNTGDVSDEGRIVSTLLTGYNTNVRPVINASKAVDVTVGLAINQIIEVV